MSDPTFSADPLKGAYTRLSEIEAELVEARRQFTRALSDVRKLQDDIRPMIIENGS